MLSFDDILQTAENTHSINAILAFLAADDSAIIGPARIDLVVHAGNAILATAQQACALAKQAGCPLLLSGGVGHSTTLLHEAVRAAGYSAVVQTQSRTEAESVGDIAVACWGMPSEQLILETHSTNCGENAAFTRNKLAELGMAPSNIVVVQDPLMQLRTVVTFQKAWCESKQPPRFYSWPTFVPALVERHGTITYAPTLPAGLWAPERLVSLLLGEMARLRDTEAGYGPRGKGFIPHIEIPPRIEACYQSVLAQIGGLEGLRTRLL
ncbi:hypothetical protein HK15_10220 [Acetobacter orientalis]|uniref:DUF218 domain-containing protein n=1 Tax=Acetobacter orientalis TaxID=146474 RepID=A0A252B6U1_9PROT|nr:YdcF family protein [Acetobacter orientalis]OUJ00083.1 hypothetical protein HK15_10220 [Acetobacter orientalis]